MTKTIQREMVIPQAREQVWQAITDSEALADWMFPNDMEPRLGHRFTFRVPPKPEVNFEGMSVHCEVLECEPPSVLTFSWVAGGLADSRVSFRLEPEGEGTRLHFEHSGFDVSQPWGEQAFKGAAYGWANMLGALPAVVARLSTDRS
ncbi:SRPBCC domain-containing protein [soil metagenome]